MLVAWGETKKQKEGFGKAIDAFRIMIQLLARSVVGRGKKANQNLARKTSSFLPRSWHMVMGGVGVNPGGELEGGEATTAKPCSHGGNRNRSERNTQHSPVSKTSVELKSRRTRGETIANSGRCTIVQSPEKITSKLRWADWERYGSTNSVGSVFSKG